MLYVFSGSDTQTVRENAHATLELLRGEGGEVIRLTTTAYYPGLFSDCAGGASLFGVRSVYLVDLFSEEVDAFEALTEALGTLAESEHAFVIVERALSASEKKVFQKHAAEYAEHTAPKEERFNIFGLTEALLARDKKTMWLCLMDAREAGMSSEEIIGTLFWQVKTVRLVARSKSAEEAGVKPFVYTKSKSALSKFKPGEIDKLSSELVSLYHEGHSGRRDSARGIEQWVLSL